jgi:hypothetical protein
MRSSTPRSCGTRSWLRSPATIPMSD